MTEEDEGGEVLVMFIVSHRVFHAIVHHSLYLFGEGSGNSPNEMHMVLFFSLQTYMPTPLDFPGRLLFFIAP